MREAFAGEGIDESVLRREAEKRTGPTFIHRHSYNAHCMAEMECYVVQGVVTSEQA